MDGLANSSANSHLFPDKPSRVLSALTRNLAVQIRSVFDRKSDAMSFGDERIVGPTKSDELDVNKLGRIHPQPESPDIDMGDECSRTIPRFFHFDNVSSSGA